MSELTALNPRFNFPYFGSSVLRPTSQHERDVSHSYPVVEKLWIFRRRLLASMQQQVGLASYIGGKKGCTPAGHERDNSKLVRGRRLEKLEGFGRVVVIKFDGGASGTSSLNFRPFRRGGC